MAPRSCLQSLPASVETLAEHLREAGYFNAGFAGGFLCHHSFGLGQGFHLFRDPDDFETTADRLTGYVEKMLAEYHDRPFFLFVNYFDPHAMYRAPEEYRRRLEDDLRPLARLDEIELWEEFTKGGTGVWSSIVKGESTVTPDVREYVEAAYLAEVAFVDSQVGRLFAALKHHGVFEKALVIVTADHGELLGEEGFFSHAHRLDPGLMEIPLLVKWPHQEEGERVGALVSQVDIFPTVLRVVGLPIPRQRGLLLNRQASGRLGRREKVFMEEHESRYHPLFENMKVANHLYGAQTLEWRKLVWEGGETCFQHHDSGWTREVCPPELDFSLDDVEATLHAVPVEPAGSTLTAEEEEGLRALGYL